MLETPEATSGGRWCLLPLEPTYGGGDLYLPIYFVGWTPWTRRTDLIPTGELPPTSLLPPLDNPTTTTFLLPLVTYLTTFLQPYYYYLVTTLLPYDYYLVPTLLQPYYLTTL